MMTTKKIGFLLAWSVTVFTPLTFAQTNETWLSVKKKVWDNAKEGEPANTKLYLYSEVRQRDDEREIYGAFNGVVLRHDINPFLQIGAGIKHITFRSGFGGFDPSYRTELEVTSGTLIGENDQLKISVRNRWELFKNKGKRDINRLRHRIQLQGEAHGSFGLSGWFISHEIIYSRERGDYIFQQYRTIPAGLSFTSSGKVKTDIFYMITRHYGRGVGSEYVHVLGLNVSF